MEYVMFWLQGLRGCGILRKIPINRHIRTKKHANTHTPHKATSTGYIAFHKEACWPSSIRCSPTNIIAFRKTHKRTHTHTPAQTYIERGEREKKKEKKKREREREWQDWRARGTSLSLSGGVLVCVCVCYSNRLPLRTRPHPGLEKEREQEN